MCPVGYVVIALALFALACLLFIGFSENVIGVVLAIACVIGGFVLLSGSGSCHAARTSALRPVTHLQTAAPPHGIPL